jgi:hypothetical protein
MLVPLWVVVVVVSGLLVALDARPAAPVAGIVFVAAAVGVPAFALAERLFPGGNAAVQRAAGTIAIAALALLGVGTVLVLTPFALTRWLVVASVAVAGALQWAVASRISTPPPARPPFSRPRPSAVLAGLVAALLLAATAVVTVVSQAHAPAGRVATALTAVVAARSGDEQRVEVTIQSHEASTTSFTLRLDDGADASRSLSFTLQPGQQRTEVLRLGAGRVLQCRLYRGSDTSAYRVLRLGT